MEVSCATLRSSPNFCSNSSSSTQSNMDGGMDTDTEFYAKFRCHRKSFSFNRCSSSQFPSADVCAELYTIAICSVTSGLILNTLQSTVYSLHNCIWARANTTGLRSVLCELAIVYEL